MAKISASDLPNVVDLFGAYISATNSIAVALHETGCAFKKYHEPFDAVARDVEQSGTDLKVALNKVGLFSPTMTQLIHTGAISGKLPEVLKQISASSKRINQITLSIIQSVAIQVFLLFSMITVAPYLLYLISNKSKNKFLISFRATVDDLMSLIPYVEMIYPLVIVIGAGLLMLYKPIRQPLLEMLAKVPYFRGAIINFQTGAWCNYCSLMCSAGISLPDAERLLRSTIIHELQDGFAAIFRNIDKGWPIATTPDSDSDPRKAIPHIVLAFIRAGGQSGFIDQQLKTASDFQLAIAGAQFETISKAVSLLVMCIVAVGILFLGTQVYTSRF
jgi:type II secretory pathway component PulF